MRPNAWQLKRRIQTESGDPEIDQLDRLAFEKEGVAFAIESAECLDQLANAGLGQWRTFRQGHGELISLTGYFEIGAAHEANSAVGKSFAPQHVARFRFHAPKTIFELGGIRGTADNA